jgi:hypothetical protein
MVSEVSVYGTWISVCRPVVRNDIIEEGHSVGKPLTSRQPESREKKRVVQVYCLKKMSHDLFPGIKPHIFVSTTS